MTIELNHTIVHQRTSASSDFLGIFSGCPARWRGPFLAIEVANKVTLDFRDTDGEVDVQHYCFLVGEDEFDEISVESRRKASCTGPTRATNWARSAPTTAAGGVYFDDPSGHQLEIITRPHGEARGQVAVLANPKAGGRPTLR